MFVFLSKVRMSVSGYSVNVMLIKLTSILIPFLNNTFNY